MAPVTMVWFPLLGRTHVHTHVSVILHTLGCRVRVLSALLSTLDCGRVSHQPAVSVWPGAQRRFSPMLFAVWDGLLAHHLSARPPSHTSHYVLSRSLSWEQAASLFANVNSAERLRGMGDRKQAEPPGAIISSWLCLSKWLAFGSAFLSQRSPTV